jgi:hypothetical protein
MGFNNTIYRVFIPLTLLLATSHVKADSLQLAENPFGSQTAPVGRSSRAIFSWLSCAELFRRLCEPPKAQWQSLVFGS